jgi:hypothetical protein
MPQTEVALQETSAWNYEETCNLELPSMGAKGKLRQFKLLKIFEDKSKRRFGKQLKTFDDR